MKSKPLRLYMSRDKAHTLCRALRYGDVHLSSNADGTERRLISSEALRAARDAVASVPDLEAQIFHLQAALAAAVEQARQWKRASRNKTEGATV